MKTLKLIVRCSVSNLPRRFKRGASMHKFLVNSKHPYNCKLCSCLCMLVHVPGRKGTSKLQRNTNMLRKQNLYPQILEIFNLDDIHMPPGVVPTVYLNTQNSTPLHSSSQAFSISSRSFSSLSYQIPSPTVLLMVAW
jgi:hypothetical protein